MGLVVFAGLGTLLLVASHAATPTAAIQAEGGTVTSPAAVVGDAAASGGQVVKFDVASAYPNASNTGPAAAGFTSFTSHAGGWTISTPGTYSGYDVSGTVVIQADGVIFKGNKVHGHADQDLITVTGKNVQILDNEIYGNANTTASSPEQSWIGLFADGAVIKRNNLYNSSGDGIRLAETNGGTVADNYIHDWVQNPTNGPHVDGVVTGGGGNDSWLIQHNTILMWSPGHLSNVISLANAPNVISNVTVDNNLLAGGGYTIHGGGDANYSTIKFTNNKFSTQFSSACGLYGIMTEAPAWGTRGSVWTNNTWYDGAQAGQTIATP